MSTMYYRIKEIAIDHWDDRMTFGELAEELGLPSPWHAGQQIKRAWDFFKRRGDTYACAAISRVFWSQRNVNKR